MSLSFLQSALSYLPSDEKLWDKYLFVFPTKRAAILFNDLIKGKFSDKNFIFPKLVSITELISELTQKEVAPELILLHNLYIEYHKFYPDKTFWQFTTLGKSLLKDFDELDRYLVNAKDLFRDFEYWKDTEIIPELQEEIRAVMRLFRFHLIDSNSPLQSGFMDLWKNLNSIYHNFIQSCVEQETYSEGYLYRSLAETGPSTSLQQEITHTIFCGFFSLSTAEEKIIEFFINKGNTKLLWDSDRFYAENPYHEAYNVIKKIKKKWSPEISHWIENDGFSEPKKINTYYTLHSQEMAAMGMEIIQQIPIEEHPHTVLVLMDESWIQALLPLIPTALKSYNISMGYKLTYAHYPAYIELITSLRNTTDGYEKLMTHPITELLESDETVENQFKLVGSTPLNKETFINLIKGNTLKNLLAASITFATYIDHLIELLQTIFEKTNILNKDPNSLDNLLIGATIKEFRKLKIIVLQIGDQVPENFWNKLIDIALSSCKINFEGRANDGLQIMGFLETRCLDYKHVIILGANEGLLPASPNQISLLPNSIKKAFGLPVMEEHDAIFSFHFYRLLQRADNVHLVIGTAKEAIAGAEPSRYIKQLKYAKMEYPNATINRASFQAVNNHQSTIHNYPAITIPKTKKTRMLLKQFRSPKSNTRTQPKKYFSPTSITTYIHCSLKFYYRYLLKLQPEDQPSIELDPRNMGLLFHKLAESIYPKTHTMMDKNLLKKISTKEYIQAHRMTFLEHWCKENNIEYPMSAYNDLLLATLQIVLSKLMMNEASNESYLLMGKEESIKTLLKVSTNWMIGIQGNMDRFDKIGDDFRIVDYKLGKTKKAASLPVSNNDNPETWEKFFNNPSNLHLIQLLLYASILRKTTPGNYNINILLYYLQSLENSYMPTYQNLLGSYDFQKKFYKMLRGKLRELFNPSIPFEQTKDLKKCLHCDYKNLCKR